MDWRSRTLKKKRCSPKGNAFLILVRREKEGVWGIKIIKKCKLNGGEDSGGRPLHFSRVQVWHSVPDILFVIAYLPVYNYFPILTSMVHFPFPHRSDPTPTPSTISTTIATFPSDRHELQQPRQQYTHNARKRSIYVLRFLRND